MDRSIGLAVQHTQSTTPGILLHSGDSGPITDGDGWNFCTFHNGLGKAGMEGQCNCGEMLKEALKIKLKIKLSFEEKPGPPSFPFHSQADWLEKLLNKILKEFERLQRLSKTQERY